MRTLPAITAALSCLSAAQARDLVNISFDAAPSTIPQTFYSSFGVSLGMANGQPGPAGGGQLTAISAAGMPSPASGQGLRPYANLAGFLGAFEFSFSTAIDYFALHAFDGAQAVSVQAHRFGQPVASLNIPAQPGRTSILLELGAIGDPLRIDHILITPSTGIGPGDPSAGPTFYDNLSFNPVPAPATLAIGVLTPLALRRRRR